MARTGFPSRWHLALLDLAAAQSLGSPVPGWAMAPPRDAPVPQGCSSPADTGSQLLLQPSDRSMAPGTVSLSPGPLRQCCVSRRDKGGCGLCGGAGCSSLRVQGRVAEFSNVSAPQGRVAGSPMSPKPGGGHADTLRSQGRVARSPKCFCNPGQCGLAGSQGTQISPCLRTGRQGPQMSLHPRACACPRKREIITQKTVKGEALA